MVSGLAALSDSADSADSADLIWAVIGRGGRDVIALE
jgi:hypothetical protein